MLTAKLKNGKTICLAYGYSLEALKQLRETEEFFCPSCGQKVIVKLGSKKIHHFAHLRDGCEESMYDRESQYHLKGKLAIYSWLRRQNIPAAMEQYDPVIQQRPDITFIYKERLYALEYQCSPLSEAQIKKRTIGFQKGGYIPIWILGALHLPKSYKNPVQLSGFHYLFFRDAPAGPGYIPFFCSETDVFYLLHSISPTSPSKAFVSIDPRKASQASLSSILQPPRASPVPLGQWKRTLVYSRLSIGANPHTPFTKFLHELYQTGLNIFLLPKEIGQPGLFSVPISTYPVVWQTYLYLDLLKGKPTGSFVTAEEAVQALERRITRGEISARVLPLSKDMTLMALAYEYLSRLALEGILERRAAGVFLYKKEMAFPKTTAEQMAMENEFYSLK